MSELSRLYTFHSLPLLGSKKKTELKRDKWWAELRSEVRGHARALCCNCVLGYEETVTMYEETAVLTASGTAVYLKPVVGVMQI